MQAVGRELWGRLLPRARAQEGGGGWGEATYAPVHNS